MLASFQSKNVLLLWHIVSQGPAVLAASAGQVGRFFFVLFLSHLSYLPFLMPNLFRDSWKGLKHCGLCRYDPVVVVSYYPGHAR